MPQVQHQLYLQGSVVFVGALEVPLHRTPRSGILTAVSDSQEQRVFHGPKDYLDLARSPGTTVDELRELAGSPYRFVVQAVAEHPRTPVEVLRSLIPDSPRTWNDYTLVMALARHPNA